MKISHFTDPYKALNHLLDVHEEQPDRRAYISAKPDYENLSFRDVGSFHAVIKSAEQSTAITLLADKSDLEKKRIQSFRLNNVEALYNFCKRAPVGESVANALLQITSSLPTTQPEWLSDEIEIALGKWRVHKSYEGLALEQIDDAVVLFRMLEKIVDGTHSGLDIRSFGIEVCKDSKALDNQLSRVAIILKRLFEIEGERPEEILGHFGIHKYPDPVWIKGPLVIEKNNVKIPVYKLTPFFTVNFDDISSVIYATVPSYVLTIENKSSFNRYVRTIKDNGLIIYTNGFPSQTSISFLKHIACDIGDQTRWYHWSDIDAGGVRIFRHIETAVYEPLGLTLTPHLMAPEYAEKYGVPSHKKLSLRTVAQSTSAIAEVASYLCRNDAHTLEQETLSPVAPTCLTMT